MNYAEMTNFEINSQVARAVDFSGMMFFDVDSSICSGPVWSVESGITDDGIKVSRGNAFNPCNSWADAGPIIEKENISLTCHQSRDEWAAIFNRHAMAAHSNPLRAAMECYLMKKERENAA